MIKRDSVEAIILAEEENKKVFGNETVLKPVGKIEVFLTTASGSNAITNSIVNIQYSLVGLTSNKNAIEKGAVLQIQNQKYSVNYCIANRKYTQLFLLEIE